jgi:3-dehydroquinate dehydratase-2
MARLLLINGPNLNLLGTREPHVYGTTTLKDVETMAQEQTEKGGGTMSVFQSNHEGVIIDRIHAARDERVKYIIINPGAYTHTSVAIRDALLGVGIKIHRSAHHQRPFAGGIPTSFVFERQGPSSLTQLTVGRSSNCGTWSIWIHRCNWICIAKATKLVIQNQISTVSPLSHCLI